MLRRFYTPLSVVFEEAPTQTAVFLRDAEKRIPGLYRLPEAAKDALKKSPQWTYPRGQYEKSLIVQPSKKFREDRNQLFSTATQAVKAAKARKISDMDLILGDKLKQSDLEIWLNTAILSNYKYDRKTKDPEDEEPEYSQIDRLNVLNANVTDSDQMERVLSSARCALFAREIANTRGSEATPCYIEDRAREICDTLEVIRGDDLLAQDMNMLHAVGRSAQSPPRMIHMKHEGAPGSDYKLAVVGKGVTFDTGGLNLKPSNFIEDMYLDKSGACVTLGLFKWIKEMNIPINISCVLALAENAIDSKSFKPSDIITSKKGITVEIGNTDAEGRLCLGDAMTWVQQHESPKEMVDIATLTGAVLVALGEETAGLFGNDKPFLNELIKSGEYFQEDFWHLPITKEHRESIKGKTADISNTGSTRWGGSSTAAAFLERFVEKDVKWAHMDIAGAGMSSKERGQFSAGGTAHSLQALTRYIMKQAKLTK